VAAIAAAGLAQSVTAQASPAARLVYVRSPDALSCPDEGALRRAVSTRFGYDPFFPWARATIVVQVWREGGHLKTRIQLVDDDGVGRGTRELSSDRPGCGEIFGATALAISIALETPAADETAAPVPPPAPAPMAAPAPAPTAAPAPAPMAAPASAPDSLPAPPRTRDVGWSAGLESAVTGDVSPLPGLGLFGRARFGAFSLSLEGLAELSVPTRAPGSMHEAAFGAVLAPCAHLGPAFGCAVGELGELVAWAANSPDGHARQGLLALSGLRVGVEWPASGTLALQARGDALANLMRHEVQLGDNRWPEPPVTYGFGLGVVVRFR
jgi:hypothetical protein